ncbi:hypothetical protein LTR37_003849 [Vermiconidia calcicola]|uniref:Uncharacterized protein n=1 Tax=Vermiconidia calcicola TaxID=1690605 RepID=A0ACC3NNT3_9PEZI|nr:hypothetical protein LTR37_003849 [Vermiconidia calcicola]
MSEVGFSSYGVASISIMGQVGCVYLNFCLWAISVIPAWFVIKEFGTAGDTKLQREEKEFECVR